MKIENRKYVTFNDLLEYDNSDLHVTYVISGRPKHKKLESPEEVLSFISENIYELDYLSINDVTIDINKLIEKYSR